MARTPPKPRPELEPFAAWLRARLKERRLGKNQLAEYLGVSQGSVSEYARALRWPRLESLRKLAKFFDVPLEQLEALLPAEEVETVPVDPLPPERVPDWARPLLDFVDEVRRRGLLPAPDEPPGHVVVDRRGVLDAESVRARLSERALAGLFSIQLAGQQLPVVPDPSAAWFDPSLEPAPGDVVGVRLGRREELFLVEPDGRLTSPDPALPVLRLDEVDHADLLGVMQLAQIPFRRRA